MLGFNTFVAIGLLLSGSANSEPAPAVERAVQQYSPFIPPSVQQGGFVFLLKRQSCQSGYNSCANEKAADACCPSGTNCARDSQGNIACCPVNNYCTGVIGSILSSTDTASQTPQAGSGTTGFVGTVTVTSTAGVTNTGGTQTTPTSVAGTVAGGESAVPNAYYPYVYIPTSFGNAAVCSSYYTSCQTASTSCFQSLAGANGVTIGGVTGGTTQVGSTGMLQASASSICSSLSQEACRGIQSSQCSQIGSGGTTVSGFVQKGNGPRETGCPGMLYMAAAGAVVGGMGIVM